MNFFASASAAAFVFAGAPGAADANSYTSTVVELQSKYNGGNCFFFRLNGVAEADPVAPNNPWFAIDRGSVGATDAYAMLLTARVTEMPVKVLTNGSLACGAPAAIHVFM